MIKLKIICGFVLVSVWLGALPLWAQEEKVCQVSLEIFGKEIWTLKVEPDRIAGSDNVLKRDGNIIYGYVIGKSTRLKIDPGQVVGKFIDETTLLNWVQKNGLLEIRGVVGKDNLVVEMTPERLLLSDKALTLTLIPKANNPARWQDKKGHVQLLFESCDMSVLTKRLELALLLHRAILQEVSEFHDVL
jgi:hypothetical protein